MPDDLISLLSWFQSHHGSIDLSSITLTDFPPTEGGRGALALKDIPKGHTLFSIPRALSLSTRTSSLPTLFGLEQWKKSGLDKGWVGLILVMMWEGTRGGESVWSEYLASLPTKFDTLMFWSLGELEELRGTSVVEKIGRGDVERDYQEKLLPAIYTRPDLFPPELKGSHYSMEQYHIMGSRILSRSFNVEMPGHGDADDEGEGDGAPDTSRGSGMDVDEEPPASESLNNIQNGDEETRHGSGNTSREEEEEDEVEEVEVCMLPMADMLNARYGSENAKLFYEEHSLEMISTRPIQAGDQIWNTYGNLPNAELLRRYGHVDILPLPLGGEGNPGDVVEIGADVVLDAVAHGEGGVTKGELEERVDWWLEEGGDDVFVIEFDLELPPELVAFVRLVTLLREDWVRTKVKGKVPKPKVDLGVLRVIEEVLRRRMVLYPTGIQEDEAMLHGGGLSTNKRHAIIVRVGEKRILGGAMGKAKALMAAEAKGKANGNGKNKRKGEISTIGSRAEETGLSSKKSRLE